MSVLQGGGGDETTCVCRGLLAYSVNNGSYLDYCRAVAERWKGSLHSNVERRMKPKKNGWA